MIKRILVFLAIAFVLCGCKHSRQDIALETTLYHEISEPYTMLLSDYNAVVNFRISSNFVYSYNEGVGPEISNELAAKIDEDFGYQFHAMLAEMVAGLDDPSLDSFGYILQDINNDGFEELFWVREDYFILAIFTIRDNHFQMIDAFWPRYKAVVTDEGFLYTRSSGGADVIDYKLVKISEDGSISESIEFGLNGQIYYEVIEGKKQSVTQERFEQLVQRYPFEDGDAWRDLPIYRLGDT